MMQYSSDEAGGGANRMVSLESSNFFTDDDLIEGLYFCIMGFNNCLVFGVVNRSILLDCPLHCLGGHHMASLYDSA